MGEICSNTWSVDYIVECKLVNERGGFAEERQRLRRSVECLCAQEKTSYLSDTSRGAQNDGLDHGVRSKRIESVLTKSTNLLRKCGVMEGRSSRCHRCEGLVRES